MVGGLFDFRVTPNPNLSFGSSFGCGVWQLWTKGFDYVLTRFSALCVLQYVGYYAEVYVFWKCLKNQSILWLSS